MFEVSITVGETEYFITLDYSEFQDFRDWADDRDLDYEVDYVG